MKKFIATTVMILTILYGYGCMAAKEEGSLKENPAIMGTQEKTNINTDEEVMPLEDEIQEEMVDESDDYF